MFKLEEKLDFLKKINSDDYNYEKINSDEQITVSVVSVNDRLNKQMTIPIGEFIYYIIQELEQVEQSKHSSMLIEQIKRFLDKYMDDIDKEFDENDNTSWDLAHLACNDDLFLYFLNKFGMKLNDIIGVYIYHNDSDHLMTIMDYLVKYNIKINKKSIEKNISLINNMKDDISFEQVLNYIKTNYDIE